MTSMITPTRCRVCLSETDMDCTLFKHCGFAQMSYADMLCFITDIKVTVNDGLPDKICKSCSNDLEKAYSFTVLAKSSDKKLREFGKIKKKLSFNSITDIKRELKKISAKKPKTKLSFDSITDIKCKLEDLNVKTEKSWEIAIVNENIPAKPGKTSVVANTTIKKIKTEDEPVCKIEISDDDDGDNDDNFFRDDFNNDPDYTPSDDEALVPSTKTKTKPSPTKPTPAKPADKKNKPIEMRLKIGNACIITNPELKIKKIPAKKGAVTMTRMLKPKPAVNGKSKVINKSKDYQIKITNASKIVSRRDILPCREKSVCPSCGILTWSLEQHMITHQEKEFKCMLCAKEYHKQAQLDDHMRHHTGERSFMCDTCGKGYLNKRNLIRHNLSVHQNKSIICTVCNKAFSSKSTLRNHMDTHAGIKRHQCNICGMAFRRHHHLKAHMVTHTGERSYSCEVCNSDFKYKVNLNSHVQRDHNIDIKGRQITKFTRELLQKEIAKIELAIANEMHMGMQNLNNDQIDVGLDNLTTVHQ